MKSTHDVVYFVRPVYSKGKSGIPTTVAGAEAFGSSAASYATEEVEDTVTDAGDHQNFSATPSYDPIRPSTVAVLYNGVQVATDNGSNVISGSVTIGATTYTITGTVTYTDGASAIAFALGSAAAADPAFTVSYRFDSEQDVTNNLGGVDIVFGNFPVVARPHKLELKWSVDAALTAAANIGIDVEDQLSIFAAQELKAQQDMSLVNTLIRAAGSIDNSISFDAQNPSQYYPDYAHAQGLRVKFAHADNRILTTTGRGEVSWYVVSNSVEAYMSYLDGYHREAKIVPIGVYRVGTYQGKPVFKYAHMTDGDYLVGYKGSIFGETTHCRSKTGLNARTLMALTAKESMGICSQVCNN